MLSRLSAAATWAVAPLAILAVLATAPAAHANPADVTVGMLRAPVNRAGVGLRAEPKMGSNILGQVPHGVRLTVQAVENGWLKVTTEVTGAEGKKSTQTGWVRSVETVQPYALTGGPAVGAGSGAVGAQAAAAAGRGGNETRGTARGFSDASEQDLMQTDAQIAAAYPLVDKVENTVPSPAQVATFAKQGRLGMPGRTR